MCEEATWFQRPVPSFQEGITCFTWHPIPTKTDTVGLTADVTMSTPIGHLHEHCICLVSATCGDLTCGCTRYYKWFLFSLSFVSSIHHNTWTLPHSFITLETFTYFISSTSAGPSKLNSGNPPKQFFFFYSWFWCCWHWLYAWLHLYKYTLEH